METGLSSDVRAVIKITDAHLNDLYSNPALAEISGYDAEELERLGWINIVDPQAQSLFEEIIRSLDKIPYVRECFEADIVCRNGSSRALAWEVVSLAPDQFPLMLILARESQQKRLPGSGFVRTRYVSPIPSGLWEEVFDTLPDCVSVHDENFTIIAANNALCERLGLSRSEIVGRKCHEIFHGTAQPVEHCVLLRATSGRQGRRVRRESYERHFKGVCQVEAALFASNKPGLRGIIHTLRTSESFESGSGAASRRELDSLSRLASAIAHDYNNLLSGIVGYTGMLQMLPDMPAKAQHYVAELQKSASRLNEMTQRLLLFGRQRVLRAQPIDLGRLVGEALRSTDVVSSDEMVLFEMSEEPVRAQADPMQIRIVLANLVRNALEATAPTGGEVAVRVLRRNPSKPFATFFDIAPAGEYATIEVRDSGPGIPSERLVHVFEPFSQGENRPMGRGLGLATVYRIVQNHGGFIEAESEPGLGTRITVLLPVATDAAELAR
jgi:PAS domain S-box-containing protein